MWGPSLGGGHVITIAAEDPAVAQIAWLGDGRPRRAKLRHALRWNSVKLTTAALRDAARARRGGAPLLMLLCGEPGSGAMFTDQGAKLALDTSGSQNTLWRNHFGI